MVLFTTRYDIIWSPVILALREELCKYLSLLVSTAADGMIFVLVENKRRRTRYLVPFIRNAISELSLQIWVHHFKYGYIRLNMYQVRMNVQTRTHIKIYQVPGTAGTWYQLCTDVRVTSNANKQGTTAST